MERKFLAVLMAGSLGFSGTSHAEEIPQDSQEPVSLGEVLVTPRRIPGSGVEESRFPGSVTVISEPMIVESRATSLPQLLNRFEGVSVSDSRGFGLGADTGLNLRGFVNGSRTNALVLVDGIRQNRITGDEVHWPAIPVEQIERIEIIRGGGGTIYGEGALSGAINIITKKGGTKPFQMEGSAEVGSYDLFRSTSLVRGSKDRFSYAAGVTRQTGAGYRDGTGFRATTEHLVGSVRVSPQTELELTARHHEDTTGFGGGLTKAVVEQDRRNRGAFFGFNADELDTFSAQMVQHVGSAWTLVGNLFDHRRDADVVTSFGRFGTTTSTIGCGLRAQHEWARDHWEATSIMGVDLSKDKASTGDRGLAKSESNRVAYGLFAEEAITFFKRLTLTLGFRYDKSRYEEDLTFPAFAGTLRFSGKSPKVGVNFSANPALNLYTSFARTFKAPNIDDLDAVLPPFNDSVDLKPQQADHYELGARWQVVPWAKVKAAGFFIHTQDEILFNPFAFANANFTTQRQGLELGVSGESSSHRFNYYANYTFMRAHFHKGAFTGYELPLTPEHQASAGVHVPLTQRLSTDLSARWVGHQFRLNDFNNRFPADIYGVVDLTISYQFPKRPRPKVFFSLYNLLDEEYESFPSSTGAAVSTGENPAPPRTFGAGVSWEF